MNKFDDLMSKTTKRPVLYLTFFFLFLFLLLCYEIERLFNSYEIVIALVSIILINAKICSYVKMYCIL